MDQSRVGKAAAINLKVLQFRQTFEVQQAGPIDAGVPNIQPGEVGKTAEVREARITFRA